MARAPIPTRADPSALRRPAPSDPAAPQPPGLLSRGTRPRGRPDFAPRARGLSRKLNLNGTTCSALLSSVGLRPPRASSPPEVGRHKKASTCLPPMGFMGTTGVNAQVSAPEWLLCLQWGLLVVWPLENALPLSPHLPRELREIRGVFGEEEIYLRSLSAGRAGGR